jgi:hypothetical protein
MKYQNNYKITQLLPCSDVWIFYESKDCPHDSFYDRAVALALIEYIIDGEIFQMIKYLGKIDIDFIDLEGNQLPIHIRHCKHNPNRFRDPDDPESWVAEQKSLLSSQLPFCKSR